jgi:hypothetical protein
LWECWASLTPEQEAEIRGGVGLGATVCEIGYRDLDDIDRGSTLESGHHWPLI